MRAGDFCSIPASQSVGSVRGDELRALYTDRLVPLRGPGRAIYDALVSATPNGKCPLCGHRQAVTLDHFLPKSRYAALAVAPLNLVPCCTECNHAKRDIAPTRDDEVTLHPYFDAVDGERWLYAEVVEIPPTTVRFLVQPPSHWNSQLSARVRYHFKVLDLPKLYRLQAAEELLNRRFGLEKVLRNGGWREVSRLLSLEADSRERVRRNSWQTALYSAWSQSEWFCQGGFL